MLLDSEGNHLSFQGDVALFSFPLCLVRLSSHMKIPLQYRGKKRSHNKLLSSSDPHQLTFYLTYILTFHLTHILTVYHFYLKYVLTNKLTYPSDILPGILSDILSGIYLASYLTYILTNNLRYILTFYLVFSLTYIPTKISQSIVYMKAYNFQSKTAPLCGLKRTADSACSLSASSLRRALLDPEKPQVSVTISVPWGSTDGWFTGWFFTMFHHV